MAGYRKEREDLFLRRFFALIFRIFSGIFFGVWLKDIDCAFKLFKRDVLKDFSLFSSGALINFEILAKLKKRGYFNFLEIPVEHFKRKHGKQTGGNIKVILKAIFNFFIYG